MFRAAFFADILNWLGRGCAAVALVACLGLCGCKHVDLDGEGFKPDPVFDSGRQARKPDAEGEGDYAGVSNKARQIERDCGIR